MASKKIKGVSPAVPSFRRQTEIARYIRPEDRGAKRHAAATAFHLSDIDLTDNAPHLSVNAVDIEGIDIIADQFRRRQGSGEVAVCTHKVQRYLEGAKKQGFSVTSNPALTWAFAGPAGVESAFRHRPTQISKSHSGVEFIRALPDVKQKSLARYLARYPKFHLR